VIEEHPIRSKSSVYFERYAKAEQQRTLLVGVVYVLGAVCVAFAMGLISVAVRPKPIHYVSAVPVSGISYPGQVPVSSVVSFTGAWIMDWMNYTPDTAQGVYQRALLLVMPSFMAKLRAGLDEELQKISRDRLASVFTLKAEPRCMENEGGFAVIFEGDRRIYMGKEEMSREAVRFTVNVRRTTPTTLNPYGLAVEDVRKEKVRHDQV